MMEDPILTAARKRLAGTHATLYGRAWNVHEDEDLEKAAMWLASEVRAVLAELPDLGPAGDEWSAGVEWDY